MRRRTTKKQLWLDTNENKLLKQKANKSGLTESEFLRSCIKGYKIKEQPTKEIREFTRDISGIANNINQIARKNTTIFIIYKNQPKMGQRFKH